MKFCTARTMLSRLRSMHTSLRPSYSRRRLDYTGATPDPNYLTFAQNEEYTRIEHTNASELLNEEWYYEMAQMGSLGNWDIRNSTGNSTGRTDEDWLKVFLVRRRSECSHNDHRPFNAKLDLE